jgi:nucleoside-triphosphatase THEP1
VPATGRLQGALFTECAEWVWEQLQEEGFQVQGELIELILETERELGIQAQPLDTIAAALAEEFERRGVVARPYGIDARLIRVVLEWEDDFLGFAGIPRAES